MAPTIAVNRAFTKTPGSLAAVLLHQPLQHYNRFVVDSIISGWLQQLSSVSHAPLRAERIEIEFEQPAYTWLTAAGRLPDPVWLPNTINCV
jgi:hypothetical protein